MRMDIIVEYGDPKPRRFRSRIVLKKRRSKEFDGRGLSKLWNSIYEPMTNAINTASMTIEVQWYVSYDYFSVMWGEMSVSSLREAEQVRWQRIKECDTRCRRGRIKAINLILAWWSTVVMHNHFLTMDMTSRTRSWAWLRLRASWESLSYDKRRIHVQQTYS